MLHLVLTLSIAFLCLALGVYVWQVHLSRAQQRLNRAKGTLSTAKTVLARSSYENFVSAQAEQLQTITHDCINDLIAQAKSRVVSVDVEASLADIRAKFDQEIVWPRFTAQIAVYVGLLGTIAGLWVALASLSGAAEINNEESLRAFAVAIRELLGSLQGAFVSALAGILITVLLGAKVQQFEKDVDIYLGDLDAFLRRQLLPQLEDAKLALLPENGLEAAKLIVSKLDKSLGTFTQAWADRFGALADQTEALATAVNQLSEASKSVERSTDELAEASDSLETRLAHLAQQTVSANEHNVRTAQVVEEATSSVSLLAANATSWPDISSQLIVTAESVRATGTLMESAAASLAHSTAAVAQELSSLHSHVATISQEAFDGVSRQLLDTISRANEEASLKVAELVAANQQRDSGLRDLVERSVAATEKQAEINARMGEAMLSLVSTLPSLENPGPSIDQMLSALRSVSEAIQSQTAAFTLSSPNGHGGARYDDGLSTTLARLTESINSLTVHTQQNYQTLLALEKSLNRRESSVLPAPAPESAIAPSTNRWRPFSRRRK